MSTFPTRYKLAFLAVCLLAWGERALHAAPAVDVVSVDLAPLIDRAADSPSRFAVDIPHRVSTIANGEWSQSASSSTWTYSVQIPGAVSMSFHATDALLPSGATLVVTADGVEYLYSSKDARGGDLWSRIGRGDSLTIQLTVATEDVGRVQLEIASFQAGYRSLGDDGRGNAHYDDLRKRALTTTAACAENWTCHVNPINTGPGEATAALIINNTALCTGVLLNDVPADGAPYMLTARHCQNGSSDGGSPGAASSIVVYWHAVSACGSPLGSVFDAGTMTQFGADTVVEQQDTWLVRLKQPPVLDVYYAGWDATGSTFVGGFSPHHADGTSRQFVGWYGQAAYFTWPPETLGVKYTSTFWGTVNAVGTGGPGGSGGGLFNDSGHLVGTVVRGVVAADNTGVCPVSSPPVPTQSNAVALSTAFSGIFNSTADPGASTGTVTLQSTLDPGNTGTFVLEGKKRPISVVLHNYTESFPTGVHVPLDWQASPGTTSCTASGGETGDGWPGTVPASGSKEVTTFDGGDVVYTVTCTDGQRTGSTSVTLHWVLSAPSVSLNSFAAPEYGVPFDVFWTSNVRPCAATGGSTGDGWGGSLAAHGIVSVTETVVGSVNYTITCGSGTRVASQQLVENVRAPAITMRVDAATLRLGETVNITTFQQGGPCVKTGGAAGDGWAGTLPPGIESASASLTETTPGTYTYSMACGSGSHIATAQATVTFRNDPPAVSVHASSPTGVINADTIVVTWDANVRPCQMSVTGPTGTGYDTTRAPYGSLEIQEGVIGQYVFSITCGSGTNIASASTTMNWTGTPSVRLQAPTSVEGGALFTISYFANVSPCTTSGGTSANWPGQFNEAFKTIQLIEQTSGTQTYSVTCGSGSHVATDRVSVTIVGDAPHVTLTADRTQQAVGQPVTLTWSSNKSPCIAASPTSSGDAWTGTLDTSGSRTVTEQSVGVYWFQIFCGTGSVPANASVTVQFTLAPPSVALTVSAVAVTVGDPVTLTWTASNANACNASDGAPGDGWTGNLANQGGSTTLRETVEGTFVYTITCSGYGPNATAFVTVTMSRAAAPPSSNSGGGSSGGGGGSMGPADLAFFMAVGLVACWQRRKQRRT